MRAKLVKQARLHLQTRVDGLEALEHNELD